MQAQMHKTQRTQIGYREPISLALFFFVFLTSTFIFDEHAALLFGPSLVSPLESLMLGSSVIGFILRPYLCYRLPTRRHDVSTLIGTLAVAAIVVTIMARRTWVFLAGGIVLFATLGYIGSAAHSFLARRYAKTPYLSRAVAIAYASGIVLQFIFHILVPGDMPNQIVLVLSTLAVVTLLHAIAETKAPDGAAWQDLSTMGTVSTPATRETAVRLTVAIFCLTGIFAALNSALTLSHASNAIDLGSWPRLFLVPSALAAGMLFDKLDARRVGMIMTAVAMFSACALFILIGNVGIRASAIVFYLGSGVFVVFFTTTYMKLSAHMRMHELWPSMGRVFNNIGSMLVSAPAIALIDYGDLLGMIVATIVLLAGVAASLLSSSGTEQIGCENPRADINTENMSQQDDARSSEAASTPPAALSLEEPLERFCRAYSLTPREGDVVRALLTMDDSVSDIASALFLSRSTLYRLIASINKKTGTASRTALITFFWTWYNAS